MRRAVAILVALLLAPDARALDAERRYADLIRALQPVLRKIASTPTQSLYVAQPASRLELETVRRHLDLFVGELKETPAPERPKALDLNRKLESVRAAVAFALATGAEPGGVLQVTLKLTDDGGGWDSVRWGDHAYPSITGEAKVVLHVPPALVPSRHPSSSAIARYAWACPEAVFEPLPGSDDLVQKVGTWTAYLAHARAFVEAGSAALGRTALPTKLVIFEPPDVGHELPAIDLDAREVLPAQVVRIAQWGKSPFETAPARLAQFRAAYAELREGNDRTHFVANCVLLAQRLVVDRLGPALVEARAQAERKALKGWRDQLALLPLAVFETANDATRPIGTIAPGTRVEVLEGLTVGDAARVVAAPFLRVRDGELTGWVRSTRDLHWQAGGPRQFETVSALGREEADDTDLAQALSEAVLRWQLVDGAAKHYAAERQKKRTEEARGEANRALADVCRRKAIFVLANGAKALGPAAARFTEARVEAGDPVADVKALVAKTYAATSCGP